MTEFNQALLISHVYRYLLILAGLTFGYWGYRLFRVGYYERAGELKAAWGENHLVLKQVAPGVFFALFGAAIITVAIVRPIHVQRQSANGYLPAASAAPQTTPTVPNASAARPVEPIAPKATEKPTISPAPTQTPLETPAQPAISPGLQVESSGRSSKERKSMFEASQKKMKHAQEPAQDQKP